jgi:branched-chain amino acid transport system substrate-binding protein
MENHMKSKYFALAACAAITMTLFACGSESKKESQSSNTIKIASAGPLSGSSANSGKDLQNGAQLAIDEINASGGVEVAGKKYQIELISEDDGADLKQGATVAQKIVDNNAISAVVGHYNSGVTMAAQPIYAAAGLVTITPSASNPDVTLKSKKAADGSAMMYRMVAHDGMQGPALATYAQKKGLKKIAIIDDATTYGKGLADQVDKKAKELGMDVVTRETATDKTTDFKSILTKVKSSGADVVMWGGLDDTAATFAKQAREIGLTAKLLMPDAVCTENYITLAAGASKGTICSVTGLPLEEMKDGMAFKERFEKRFPNQKVQGFAPFAYDAVFTLVAAIKKSGSTKPADIAVAMKGLNLAGLSGSISFDPITGERNDATITILEEQSGKFVTVDKIKN